MNVFQIDWEEKRIRNLAFKINLLLMTRIEVWDALSEISFFSETELLTSIELLGCIINSKKSKDEISKAIAIVTRSRTDEGHSYLYGTVVEKVAFLTSYFDRNKIRYPQMKVDRLILILDRLIAYRSPVALPCVYYLYDQLIKPPVESAWELRGRFKLEATYSLCSMLKFHEEHIGSFPEHSYDGLRCLIDMALHPCLHISTLGYCTLLSFSSTARKRFNLIPKLLKAWGPPDDVWQEPGVGNQRISLLLNGKLLEPYIDRLIESCLDEIEA